MAPKKIQELKVLFFQPKELKKEKTDRQPDSPNHSTATQPPRSQNAPPPPTTDFSAAPPKNYQRVLFQETSPQQGHLPPSQGYQNTLPQVYQNIPPRPPLTGHFNVSIQQPTFINTPPRHPNQNGYIHYNKFHSSPPLQQQQQQQQHQYSNVPNYNNSNGYNTDRDHYYHHINEPIPHKIRSKQLSQHHHDASSRAPPYIKEFISKLATDFNVIVIESHKVKAPVHPQSKNNPQVRDDAGHERTNESQNDDSVPSSEERRHTNLQIEKEKHSHEYFSSEEVSKYGTPQSHFVNVEFQSEAQKETDSNNDLLSDHVLSTEENQAFIAKTEDSGQQAASNSNNNSNSNSISNSNTTEFPKTVASETQHDYHEQVSKDDMISTANNINSDKSRDESVIGKECKEEALSTEMSKTPESNSSTQQQQQQQQQPKKALHKRGTLTSPRKIRLLEVYREIRPFAAKSGQISTSWSKVIKRVNEIDSDVPDVKQDACSKTVKAIFEQYKSEFMNIVNRSEAGATIAFTSDFEAVAFKAWIEEERYEQEKRAKLGGKRPREQEHEDESPTFQRREFNNRSSPSMIDYDENDREAFQIQSQTRMLALMERMATSLESIQESLRQSWKYNPPPPNN